MKGFSNFCFFDNPVVVKHGYKACEPTWTCLILLPSCRDVFADVQVSYSAFRSIEDSQIWRAALAFRTLQGMIYVKAGHDNTIYTLTHAYHLLICRAALQCFAYPSSKRQERGCLHHPERVDIFTDVHLWQNFFNHVQKRAVSIGIPHFRCHTLQVPVSSYKGKVQRTYQTWTQRVYNLSTSFSKRIQTASSCPWNVNSFVEFLVFTFW